MSTVQGILDGLQFRVDNTADLYHVLDLAVSHIMKRLMYLKADLGTKELTLPVYSSRVYDDVDTISFQAYAAGPPVVSAAILDSASQFVVEDFKATMYVGSDCATNLGPFKIVTVTIGELTLLSTAGTATQAAGDEYTLTSIAKYWDLPTDFWGFKENPYLDGKTYPLDPLPSQAVDLSYQGAGEPKFFKRKGDKLYLTPETSGDYTIKGDYYYKYPAFTAVTDTIPFMGLFDDAISEALIMYYEKGKSLFLEEGVLLEKFFESQVDRIIGAEPKAQQGERQSPVDYYSLMGR